MRLHSAGHIPVVHLEIVDGVFFAEERDEAADAGGIELRIGNLLVDGRPLLQRGDDLAQLGLRWLACCDEDLRRRRLEVVRG